MLREIGGRRETAAWADLPPETPTVTIRPSFSIACTPRDVAVVTCGVGTHGIQLQRLEVGRVHGGGVVFEVQRSRVRRDVHHGEALLVHLTAMKQWRIVMLGLGTARQKVVLE